MRNEEEKFLNSLTTGEFIADSTKHNWMAVVLSLPQQQYLV